jgi:hypothetical protein
VIIPRRWARGEERFLGCARDDSHRKFEMGQTANASPWCALR